jgi:hypothetical protein
MLTRPVAARGEAAHVYPAMLPGARAVLFTITATTGGLDAAQVAVLDLVTRSYKVLVGGSDPRYVPGEPSSTTSAGHEIGHLVYVKGAALMAIRFDPARMEIHGTPVMVLPRLTTHPSGIGAFDVAGDGTIVYADAPSSDLTAGTLVLVDRQRRETPLLASLPPRPYRQPRLSPDEMQVAMAIADQEKDIWVFDLARPLLRQLTSGPLEDFFPVWTPDSRRLIFNRLGGGLFRQLADGTGTAEVLQTESGPPMLPSGMTPDGRVLFSRGRFGVMAMTLDGRRVEPLVQALDGFNVRNGVISPDGRWLAYESDHRQQRFEIYVTPYPNVKGDPRQVSMAGGTRPLWSKNSHELFFEAPDGAIMAARFDPSGGVWRSDEPMKVIDGPYATGGTGSIRNWDVAKDGRFLMVKAPRGDHSASQIQFVQHWADELQRLVPATR